MSLVFPDNTVLCNFAAVHELALLRKLLDGNGCWTEAVEYEASNSAHHLPDLSSIPGDGWLGAPIEIDQESDVDSVEGLRMSVFGGLATNPLEHLGEAQTLHVISNWPQYSGAIWVSDDQDSLTYARRQMINTKETKNLIGEATQLGWLTCDDGFALMERMLAVGRTPSIPDRPSDFQFL